MLNQSIFYIKILAVFVLAGREGEVRCCGQGLVVGTSKKARYEMGERMHAGEENRLQRKAV